MFPWEQQLDPGCGCAVGLIQPLQFNHRIWHLENQNKVKLNICDRIFALFPLQGLIKIRGDRCWRELTCMDYHYEVRDVHTKPHFSRLLFFCKTISPNLSSPARQLSMFSLFIPASGSQAMSMCQLGDAVFPNRSPKRPISLLPSSPHNGSRSKPEPH